MKRLFAALICVFFILSLAGCSLVPLPSGKDDSSALAYPTQSNSDLPVADNDSPVGDEIVLDTGKFDITVPKGYHLANDLIPEGSDITAAITDKFDNIGLLFVEESISSFEGSAVESLDDYLEAQLSFSTGEDISSIQEKNGIKYFTYTFYNEELDYTYKYYTTAIETETSYWSLQGFCMVNQYDNYEPKFESWFKSIQFH